jgi:hypothetical protein
MTVYLNGQKVSHVNDNCDNEEYCLGLITFNAEKGEYLLKVKLENTPARIIGNIISIVSVVAVLYILIKKDEKISKK